jgi:hypothetical protein
MVIVTINPNQRQVIVIGVIAWKKEMANYQAALN